MASPASPKKQIIDSIKDSTNILVTVSNNPSVDELSAALGLTIFLNKLGKHATAVVSGQIPSAMTFLQPDKTFESSADSLRDFIIALDKEKADHLRYKLEGDVVKIFITPYRTTITGDDLEFSQGDYNVELVLALNVADRDDLDAALSAHGKILHDATVATVTTGDIKSSLGTLGWREEKASGVSELTSEIIEGLKTAKAALDEQIATALLTGIVAATERFSNDLTSSRVMTIAAELIAAGANQQLIATKLQEAAETDEATTEVESSGDGSMVLEEGESTKLTDIKADDSQSRDEQKAKKEKPDDGSVGVMQINHMPAGDLDEVARQVSEASREDAARVAQSQLDEHTQAQEPQEDIVAQQTDSVEPVAEPRAAEVPVESPQPAVEAPADITEDLKQATEEVLAHAPSPSAPVVGDVALPSLEGQQPSIGGTLNATTAQAAEEKRRELEHDQNKTILTRGKPLGNEPPTFGEAPINAAAGPSDEPAPVDIFAEPLSQPPSSHDDSLATALADPLTPMTDTSVPAADAQQSALADVNAAFGSPEPVATPPAPGIPTLADIEAQAMTPQVPGLPPMPDFNSLPPLPPAPTGVDVTGLPPLPSAQATAQTQPADFNPAQFQIPTQQ